MSTHTPTRVRAHIRRLHATVRIWIVLAYGEDLVRIAMEAQQQGMLLLVFVHFLLDESESPVDDLLVKLELCFFLVKVFLGAADFDRVEVKQLVFLLEHLVEPLDLHTRMQDFILDPA